MIPELIRQRLNEQRCSPRTDEGDQRLVNEALTALGISLDSELGEFYLNYDPTLLCRRAASKELVDFLVPVVDGTERPCVDVFETPIGVCTEFVRDLWETPNTMVCLTTAEGEGAYLYDIMSGVIYDFGLQQRRELASGKLKPRWTSFYKFLEWYLS